MRDLTQVLWGVWGVGCFKDGDSFKLDFAGNAPAIPAAISDYHRQSDSVEDVLIEDNVLQLFRITPHLSA